jgi:hypothetical protein
MVDQAQIPRWQRRWRDRWNEMVKSLSPAERKEWEEYIEAREKAAFAKGWAACLAEKMGLGASATDEAPILKNSPTLGPHTEMKQLPRGVARMVVEEYMATIGARAVAQIEIIREVKTTNGIRLKCTSVARALTALMDEGKIEEVKGTKTWRTVTRLRSVT